VSVTDDLDNDEMPFTGKTPESEVLEIK